MPRPGGAGLSVLIDDIDLIEVPGPQRRSTLVFARQGIRNNSRRNQGNVSSRATQTGGIDRSQLAPHARARMQGIQRALQMQQRSVMRQAGSQRGRASNSQASTHRVAPQPQGLRFPGQQLELQEQEQEDDQDQDPDPDPDQQLEIQEVQHHPLDQPESPSSAGTPYIDLTEEPDSPTGPSGQPEELSPPTQHPHHHRHHPPPQQPQGSSHRGNSIGRNPRRTNSQRISPPQLSRSDSTFMTTQAVIDLTGDSPEAEQRNSGSASHVSLRAWMGGGIIHDEPPSALFIGEPDEILRVGLLNRSGPASTFMRGTDQLSRSIQRMIGAYMNAPVLSTNAQRATHLGLRTHREPSPKPPMELVSPARQGFTRDTCASPEQDRVAVCPACNEELAYDPTDTAGSSSATGTKKRRKRAVGEHHFWALKKCGHVYCAECFENRKPTKTSPAGVGFVSKTPSDIRCAVDGCDCKAAAKTEWVGIFL